MSMFDNLLVRFRSYASVGAAVALLLSACSPGSAKADAADSAAAEEVVGKTPAELDIEKIKELSKKGKAEMTEADFDFLLDQFELISTRFNGLSEDEAKSYMKTMDSDQAGAVIVVSMAAAAAAKGGMFTREQQERYLSMIPESQR